MMINSYSAYCVVCHVYIHTHIDTDIVTQGMTICGKRLS